MLGFELVRSCDRELRRVPCAVTRGTFCTFSAWEAAASGYPAREGGSDAKGAWRVRWRYPEQPGMRQSVQGVDFSDPAQLASSLMLSQDPLRG